MGAVVLTFYFLRFLLELLDERIGRNNESHFRTPSPYAAATVPTAEIRYENGIPKWNVMRSSRPSLPRWAAGFDLATPIMARTSESASAPPRSQGSNECMGIVVPVEAVPGCD